ncbi:MAG: ABC transporter ATP-binding protein [Clostridia bacterium]|nr:ABC transporter ATP-binding protein [Clostridia bacterium]
MEQLICKNLTLGYDGRAVSKNVSFTVNRGDYLCIVGENGAGKSTLVKALLGLNPPLSGTIEYRVSEKKRAIGYLPQHSDVQRDFPATVREIVLSGNVGKMGLRPFYTRQEKEDARFQMERLGILELQDRCYRDLSGGQKQRVLLARALCATKEMLLLDEPVAGLDPLVTNAMYELISRLNREGVTIIMVSHDIAAAVRYATHILHLGAEPVFFGEKRDYIGTEIGKTFADAAGGDRA